MEDQQKTLHSLALSILDSLTATVSESDENDAKQVYFSEGLDGMSREILSEVADGTDEDRPILISSLVTLVVLRMTYPQFSSVYLSLKTRMACSLYRFFWSADKSAGEELSEISRFVLQVTRENDFFRVEITKELDGLLKDTSGPIAVNVAPLVNDLIESLVPVDNSLAGQIFRMEPGELQDIREKIHGLLWKRIKRQIAEEERPPRLIVYVPPEYRLPGVVDFVGWMVLESLGSLIPVDISTVDDIPDGGLPALFLGCVPGDVLPRFHRGYVSSYDRETDLMWYTIRDTNVRVAVQNASSKAIFPYEGRPFNLPKRGPDVVNMVSREDKDAYAGTALTRLVAVVGCNEEESRQILAAIGRDRLTAVYVTSLGGIRYLQNDEIATRHALVFVPKASVLDSIFERHDDPVWRQVSDLLGCDAATELDCVLVDEEDKNTYVLDCNARVVVSVDSIVSLCDLSRYTETMDRIKSESSEMFAWTPKLCAEFGLRTDAANVIVEVPYVQGEVGLTMESLKEISSRHSDSSGPVWGGVMRRTFFGLHEPILPSALKVLKNLKNYAGSRDIPNVDITEVEREVISVRKSVGESVLPQSNDWATEKYRVVKQYAERLDPSERVNIINPHASDAENSFIRRMTHLKGRRRVFTPLKYALEGRLTWYTVARPGKREILEFVYPIASKAVWFVYPLEFQLLEHIRDLCHRFLNRMFLIDDLCLMLGVSHFDSVAGPKTAENTEAIIESKQNRLDALQKYFDKMMFWNDESDGCGNSSFLVSVGWKIALDNGSVIWATDDYMSLVENPNGNRAFVRPDSLAKSSIVWELQPPKEMALLSEEGIRQIVERNACPLYFEWKKLLDEYRENNRLTKRDLYERLRARGLTVGYGALLNWLSDGNVMCPMGGDRTLMLIADEIGCEDLRHQARGIAIVARIIRIINQTSARDIYDVLRRAFVNGYTSCEIEGVNVDLEQQGLFISGRVSSVERLDGDVKPGHLVNRIIGGGR